MTTQLNGAIGFADSPITYDGDAITGSLPIRIRVDAEEMDLSFAPGDTSLLVKRGVNGTVAAAHADDAPITRLYRVDATSTPQTSPVALLGPAAQAAAQSTSVEAVFVAAGAGTYTATVPIPAGATVLDVIFRNTVVWDSATSAAMTCGDDDSATGYFSSTNVKTTPAADTNGAGAGLSTRLSLGASVGTYAGGGGKFCAAAKTITCAIVAVGAGSAGRSRLLVEYAVPAAVTPVKS